MGSAFPRTIEISSPSPPNTYVSTVTSICIIDWYTRINANGPAQKDEFRDIKSAFAKFEFRHERLSLTDPLPQLNLRNSSVFSSLHEQLDHFPVKVRTK